MSGKGSGGAVVVVPFYFVRDRARAEITRRFFRSLTGLTVIGVGSEGGASRRLFCETFPSENYREWKQEWDPTKVKNPGAGSPELRAKFDYAVQQAAPLKPRTIYLAGSDDFIDAGYYTPRKADVVLCTGGLYIWPYCGRTARYYPRPVPAGMRHTGGPLGFSPAYLDTVDWRPFQLPHCEVGAEALAYEQGANVEVRKTPGVWTVRGHAVLNKVRGVSRVWPGRPATKSELAAFKLRFDSWAKP